MKLTQRGRVVVAIAYLALLVGIYSLGSWVNSNQHITHCGQTDEGWSCSYGWGKK